MKKLKIYLLMVCLLIGHFAFGQTTSITPTFRSNTTQSPHLDPLIYSYAGKTGGPDSLYTKYYIDLLFGSQTINLTLVTSITGVAQATTSAGAWLINGTRYSKGTSTVTTLSTRDATKSRFDVLYAGTDGLIHVVHGVLAASGQAQVPDIPDNTVEIAEILITPTSTDLQPSTKTPVYTTGSQNIGGKKVANGIWKFNNYVLATQMPIRMPGYHVSFSGDTLVTDSIKYASIHYADSLFASGGAGLDSNYVTKYSLYNPDPTILNRLGDTTGNNIASLLISQSSHDILMITTDTLGGQLADIEISGNAATIGVRDYLSTGNEQFIQLYSPSENKPIRLKNDNGLGATYFNEPTDYSNDLQLTDNTRVRLIADSVKATIPAGTSYTFTGGLVNSSGTVGLGTGTLAANTTLSTSTHTYSIVGGGPIGSATYSLFAVSPNNTTIGSSTTTNIYSMSTNASGGSLILGHSRVSDGALNGFTITGSNATYSDAINYLAPASDIRYPITTLSYIVKADLDSALAGVGSGTVTSITPGVGFLSHTPITGIGTMNIDTASAIVSKTFAGKYLTQATAATTYQTLANLETTLTNSATLYPSGSAVTTALSAKQNTLTFDSTPTSSSTNPVTSGGVFTALATKLPTTITTTGDIIYSSSGTTPSRLGIGSTNQVLTVIGGVPSWQPASGAVASVSNSDGTLTITPTTGAVVASLALGHSNTWTANQVISVPITGSTTAAGLDLQPSTAATSGTTHVSSPWLQFVQNDYSGGVSTPNAFRINAYNNSLNFLLYYNNYANNINLGNWGTTGFGVNGFISASGDKITDSYSNIGTGAGTSQGFLSMNMSNATSGSPNQYSAINDQQGGVYNTSTSLTNTAWFGQQLRTISGATPTFNISWLASLNGATRNVAMVLDNGGKLTVKNLVSTAPAVGSAIDSVVTHDATSNALKVVPVTNFTLSSAVTVSSAGTLSLSYGKDYSFTGTTATYTLPAISGTKNSRTDQITIKNRGTGLLTVNSNAGGNDVYSTVAIATFTLSAGSSITLMPDGTYFLEE